MQSPETITPTEATAPTPDTATRALGCLAVIGALLLLPVLCALLLYLMTVAVWSYHSFVAALQGVV